MGFPKLRLLLLLTLLLVAGGAAWWFSQPGESATRPAPPAKPLSAFLLLEEEAGSFAESQPHQSQKKILTLALPLTGLSSSDREPLELPAALGQTGWQLQLTTGGDEEKTLRDLQGGKVGAALISRANLARFAAATRPLVIGEAGYQRGSIGLLVRSGIQRIEQLRGNIVVAAPGPTETFIRRLAELARIEVQRLTTWPPAADLDAGQLHLLLAKSPQNGARFFQKALEADDERLVGCVAILSPAGEALMQKSMGRTHLLITDRNFLLNPKVLVVNASLASNEPEVVEALANVLAQLQEQLPAALAFGTAPIRSGQSLQTEPFLTRQLPLTFPPNRGVPTHDHPELFAQLVAMLKLAPGSTMRLRGHVDDSLADHFRKEETLEQWEARALGAMDLGEQRAEWVRRRLIAEGADGGRIETEGRGWLDAGGKGKGGVELQWFTLE